MATTYNPRDTRYRTNDDRYTDWVAQGRPSTDVNGNELDVRGEVVGSDAWTNDYYRQNASDLARIYGNAGVQATLNNTRDRSAEDPWNTALRGSNPTPSPIITGRTLPLPINTNQPTPVPLPYPIFTGNQPSPVQLPIGSSQSNPGASISTNTFTPANRQGRAMPGGTSRADWNRTNPNYGGNQPTQGVPKVDVGSVVAGTQQGGNNRVTTSGGNYGPSYRDYLQQGQLYHGVQMTEGGGMEFVPQYTEAEWNALSSMDRYGAFAPNSVDRNFYRLSDEDPLTQQFYQQFGRSADVDNSGFELNNQRQTGLAIGYNNDRNGVAGPQYGRLDWNQLAIDPTRLMWIDPPGTPNRRYVYELGNARGDSVVQEQARDDDSGLGDNFPAIGIATVLGGGMLANAFLPGAAAAGAETIAGTGALAESAAPVVTETMLGAPALSLPGAGAAGVASALPSLSQIANGLRTAGTVSSIINQLTNSGGGSRPSGSTPGSGSPGGNGPGGGFSIADIISNIIGGAGGNYQANRNIGHFTDLVNDMLTRGDPYSGERAAAIQRLRNLEANPGSITSNPLFSSMNDKSQMDLQRIMSARGLSVSGNEMGALQENFLANMNKFYGDEWNRTAREAGVFFDPSTIASAGMRAGGEIFGARQNRDAGLQALIAAALTGRGGGGQGGGGAGNTIADIINRIFGGDSGDGEGGVDSGDGMSDEDWSNWWDSWIEGNYGGDNPVGDAGDYNG